MRSIKLARSITIFSWKDFFEYRAYLLFWIVLESLGFFVMYFLWIYIYKSNGLVSGFTLSAMITYYFVAYIIRQFTDSYFDWNIIKKIKTGEFSHFLYRPLGHVKYYFFKNFGEKLIRTIICVPVFVVLGLFLRDYLIAPQNLLLFAVSLMISAVMVFWLNLIVAYIAFWVESAETFIYLKESLLYYLSGAMIPLVMFGDNLSKVLNYTFFRYLVSFPAEIYLGKVNSSEIILGLVVSAVWLMIFFILERVIYMVGVKKFTAVGN